MKNFFKWFTKRMRASNSSVEIEVEDPKHHIMLDKINLLIPKIELKQLTKKQLEIYHNLDAENYGYELAEKVAEKLMKSISQNDGLYFSHRDYCGIGIFYEKNEFIIATVEDGSFLSSIIAKVDCKSNFIQWLANESDKSMSLYGPKFHNQTIDISRLNWYLEDDYWPVWNSYCSYLRRLRTDN